MYRKFFNLALIISLAIGTAFAQQLATPENVPNIERLRSHINYLASDKLEGRRTGSEGANLAAEYIAKEFSRYGLQRSIGWDTPGMSILEADSPNRYLQKFPCVAGVELGRDNALRVTPQRPTSATGPVGTMNEPMDFRVGENWIPLGFSSSDQIDQAPAAFVQYGITATDLNHDDYKQRTVKGKIVIALPGTPDGENPHGQFARYEDVRWKAIAARNAGAKALLLISREENFKDEPLARLKYDNSGGDAGLPVAVISRQAARSILRAAGEQTEIAAIVKFLRDEMTNNTQFDSASNTPDWRAASLNWPLISLHTSITRREVEAANVVGIINGADPILKNETIVIGAHYDHLGRGGEGSLAPHEGDIHHGADDNASGTAGLLELARIFRSSESPRPRRTIVFIAFSGEEEGLLGSSYYVNHPLKPLENTVAMINMDMIGRMKNNKLIIGGVGTADGWRKVIDSSAKFWGIGVTPVPASYGKPLAGALTAKPESSSARANQSANGSLTASLDSIRALDLTLSEDGYGPSDHSSFYAKKVPVLFLWTGTHEDYHKPSDTADKINYEDESHILSFVTRIIRSIDSSDARPAYTVAKSESQGRTMGFRVYLGTIPNYADSGDGLLLDGVRDDSPAAKAGIKAGDRIVKLAGREVHNVYDYTYALGEMKAGQEYEVELLRGTERMKLTITPAARK